MQGIQYIDGLKINQIHFDEIILRCVSHSNGHEAFPMQFNQWRANNDQL